MERSGAVRHPDLAFAGDDDVAEVRATDPALLALVYFGIYLAYLFATLESETGHILTMVVLPLALILSTDRTRGGSIPRRVGRALVSVGLRRGNVRRGLGLTLGLGVAVGFFQVAFSNLGSEIVAVLTSSRVWIVLPLTFLVLLVTGLTEEFLFRGYLQTRLERLTGSRWWGLALASVLFGVYHLPYAYLNPRWPSAGDWGAAWTAALGQGIPGGLILGGLFLYTRKNLMAPLLLHVFIDLLPASTMLKFSGGG